MLARQ